MNIQGKTVFITGANRGIGAELVRALLKHGVGKIYAGTRNPESLPDFGDARVSAIKIDITKPDEVTAAAAKVGAVDILVNNAGVMHVNSILTATTAELAADIEVNYYGTLRVIQTFAPLIENSGGGMIANVLSVLAFAPMAPVAGYSASKAALLSATQAVRGALKPKNIKVVGIFPGPIDTELSSGLPIEKTSPDVAAEAIVQGFIDELEDIHPDPVSQQVSGFWGSNPKGLEHHFASM